MIARRCIYLDLDDLAERNFHLLLVVRSERSAVSARGSIDWQGTRRQETPTAERDPRQRRREVPGTCSAWPGRRGHRRGARGLGQLGALCGRRQAGGARSELVAGSDGFRSDIGEQDSLALEADITDDAALDAYSEVIGKFGTVDVPHQQRRARVGDPFCAPRTREACSTPATLTGRRCST